MSGIDKTREQRARTLMQSLGLTIPQQNLQVPVETIANPKQTYNGLTGGASNIKYIDKEFDRPLNIETKNKGINLTLKDVRIIKNLMKYFKNNFLFSTKDNNELSIRELAIEIYLLKTRLKQKDKIDDLLNNYVNKYKIPFEMKNDLRHRAGSALMSKYTGDTDIARLWGNFKEIRDLVIGKENDTDIDLKNNAIGRKIYLENKNLTEEELIKVVYEGIKNRTQYQVEEEETKIPWQSFLYFLNKYTYAIFHSK